MNNAANHPDFFPMNNNQDISEQLFVAKEDPASELKPAEQQASAETPLNRFLNRDFNRLGYRDGYTYCSTDIMDNAMRIIRNDFREILDEMTEEYRVTIDRLRIKGAETRLISLKLEEKVNLRITSIEETIARLENEKELSSQDEGLVMKAINNYRDGFLRGVNDNTNEMLLMSYNGLFK